MDSFQFTWSVLVRFVLNDNGPDQATVQLGGAGSHHATRWQHMQVTLIEGKGGRKEGGGGRREGAQIGQRRKGRGDFLKVNGWESGLKKKAITVHETAFGLFIGHYGLRGRLDGLIIEKY